MKFDKDKICSVDSDLNNKNCETANSNKNSGGIPNNPLGYLKRKSRIVPEEIKINPKDLKGFAMEFESIYDQYERDLEKFDTQNNSNFNPNVNNFINFDNIINFENKNLQKKSSINPFSPTKRNSLITCGNERSNRTLSGIFIPNSFDNDYINLKNDDNSNNDNEDNYFLKSRTNSILRILENNMEKKKSVDFNDS